MKGQIKFLLFLLIAISSYLGYAQKGGAYYSLQDGDFLEMGVWGLNSQELSCSCWPDDDGACGISVPANRFVYIRHNISTNCGIYIGSNSNLVIESGGSLTLLGSASMIGDGYLMIEPGATVTVGGDVHLTGNSTVWDNGLFVVDGNLTIDGSGLLCGDGVLVVDGVITGTPCNSIILPIELLYFNGAADKNSVLLSWETASEQNNDYFEIEKSTDGFNYLPLMRIDSKAEKGNSSSNLIYYAVDETPVKGMSYYRLKQTDFDKKFRYSSIISIDFLNKQSEINFYPNPSNGDVFMNFTNIENKEAVLVIRDALNNIIFSGNIKADASRGNKILTMPNDAPDGIYFCSLYINDKVYSQKLILLPK